MPESKPRFQARRFRKLIEAVEATPDKEFYMGAYAMRAACGTVACAAGQYVFRNPRCGLRVVFYRDNKYGFIRSPNSPKEPTAVLSEHFGISEHDSFDLFIPTWSGSCSRLEVLSRLRRFYREHAPKTRESKATQSRGQAAPR